MTDGARHPMRIAVGGLLLCGALSIAPPVAAAARAPDQCASLSLKSDRLTLVAAQVKGGVVTFADAPRIDSLPAFCRVEGIVRPAPGSRIGMELWLPEKWNGRLQMVGNGGYSSRQYYGQMATYLRQGYAVVSTDTGHQGDGPDFAIGKPEAIVDWAWRAVHSTAETAKKVATRYYRAPPRYSYFLGCSTGGHQAFMEAQRFPRDFDGIVAGAPGYNRVRLNGAFLWQFVQNHSGSDPTVAVLSRDDLALLQRASFAACRGTNGRAAGGVATDPYLNDPLSCRFDPVVIACPAGRTTACLTPEKVRVARAMYHGLTSARTGARLYPGWPVGSERGWAGYWADPADPSRPARADFWRIWAFDPTWSWEGVDVAEAVHAASARLSKAIDATSADLSAFRKHGGKLIHYHGLADPVVPPQDSVDYYERVRAAESNRRDVRTADYYRFFEAPGVGHCMGGDGPDQVNLQQAIEHWREQGVAPARLIATRIDATPDIPAGGSRPLCPYPQVATFLGGNAWDPRNFACRPPSIN